MKFKPTARAPKRPLFHSWGFFAADQGAFADELARASALKKHGVRRMTVRVPWNPLPVAGLGGVEMMSQNA